MNLNKITLQYTGVFDFDGMYAAIIDWAKNYGYMWHERSYKQKVPSPRGAEMEFEWDMSKNVTEYIRYKIMLTVHTWDTSETDVEVDGKKKTLTNSRLYIIINSVVETDWQERFAKGSKFTRKLGGWYEKLTAKNLEGVYADQLYYRVWNLHALLKKYFDLQSKKHVYKGYLGEG